jgi:excisionase family DNA binding protein
LPPTNAEETAPVRAMRPSAACRWLGISKSALYREIAAKRLRAVKCGAITLIPTESAEAWLSSLPSKAA